MKLKQIGLVFLICVAATTGMQAAVVLGSAQIGPLYESDGETFISTGRVAILVASTTDNVFTSPFQTELTVGSYLGGSSDDLIIGRYFTSDLDEGEDDLFGVDLSGTSFSYSGSFNEGDKLALYWFPTIEDFNSSIGGSIQYGLYRSDVVDVDAGSQISFIAPDDDDSYILATYTEEFGGIASVNDLSANFITSSIPEPSTYAAFAGLATLGLAVWRKRSRA